MLEARKWANNLKAFTDCLQMQDESQRDR